MRPMYIKHPTNFRQNNRRAVKFIDILLTFKHLDTSSNALSFQKKWILTRFSFCFNSSLNYFK